MYVICKKRSVDSFSVSGSTVVIATRNGRIFSEIRLHIFVKKMANFLPYFGRQITCLQSLLWYIVLGINYKET